MSVTQNQKSKTIRRYGRTQFLVCNSCFWCASHVGSGDQSYIENCPSCKSSRIESLPISRAEAYKVSIDNQARDISLEFWNQS